MSDQYIFGITVELIIGRASDFDVKDWILVDRMDVVRFACNAPCRGFVHLFDVQVNNVSILVGSALTGVSEDGADAYDLRDVRRGLNARMTKGARVCGRYGGLIPDGQAAGLRYTFVCSFAGAVP